MKLVKYIYINYKSVDCEIFVNNCEYCEKSNGFCKECYKGFQLIFDTETEEQSCGKK